MARVGSRGLSPRILLARDDAEPLHEQATRQLREAIVDGRLAVGSQLASTRALAQDWGVGRNTVARVYETLTDEGFLDSHVGAGTFVVDDRPAAAPKSVKAPTGAATPEDAPARRAQSFPFRRLSVRGSRLIAEGGMARGEKLEPFAPDAPDPGAFPLRTWLRLMNEVSGRLTRDVFMAAPERGYPALRTAIANHLGATRAIRCDAAQVIITSGSQQAYDLIARLLLDRDDPVWLENPCYPGVRATMAANGAGIFPVAVDRDGMRVDDAARRYPTPRLIVTAAARHYPLGPSLSHKRRVGLVAYARSSGSWVVEDDYDGEIRYDGRTPVAVKALDQAERVIHIGSFSKTLLPSLRLGYMVVPNDLASHFAHARMIIDRYPPILEQAVMADFLNRGFFAAHIRQMRQLYASRQQALVDVLRDALGYEPPAWELETGMHLVLPLKDDERDKDIAAALERRHIRSRALSDLYLKKFKRNGLIFGYSTYREQDINSKKAVIETLKDYILHDEDGLFASPAERAALSDEDAEGVRADA